MKKKYIEMATHGIILTIVLGFGVRQGVLASSVNQMVTQSAEVQQVQEVSETERPQDMASTHKVDLEERKQAESGDGTETRRAEVTMDAQLTTKQCPRFAHSREWDEYEQYLLAKLAMCEAGTQSVQTKCLVILTVYNQQNDSRFPDTVEDIIFQNDGRTWQYSPLMPSGSWWSTEPDSDCYEAVRTVMAEEYDYSGGAEYFESFGTDEEAAQSWHGKCLEFLYKSDDMRFYK